MSMRPAHRENSTSARRSASRILTSLHLARRSLTLVAVNLLAKCLCRLAQMSAPSSMPSETHSDPIASKKARVPISPDGSRPRARADCCSSLIATVIFKSTAAVQM